jgi:hypothetical protein
MYSRLRTRNSWMHKPPGLSPGSRYPSPGGYAGDYAALRAWPAPQSSPWAARPGAGFLARPGGRPGQKRAWPLTGQRKHVPTG